MFQLIAKHFSKLGIFKDWAKFELWIPLNFGDFFCKEYSLFLIKSH